VDVTECGAAFAIDRFDGRLWLETHGSEIRRIDILFEDRGRRVAIEGWKLEGRRIAIAQRGLEIRDVSLMKVSRAVIQPNPQHTRRAGLQDNDVAILIAVNVANT
jgi:hypothetical protein